MDLRQFRGPNADPSQPNKIGANAIARARAAGMSDAQIQSAMGQQGVSTSAVANQQLGTSFSQSSPAASGTPASSTYYADLRRFRGPNADPNQPNKIGANAIKRARASGMSDAQIRAAMGQSGITTSAVANQELGTNFSTGGGAAAAASGGGGTGVEGRYFDPTQYSADPNDYMGEGKFGAGALERARGAGFTDAQIRSTLAGAGVTIGQGAADALGVMAGKTFYTGADGKRRPDHVALSYRGQAGERNTRPVLLPKGAYNYAQNKGFGYNTVFAAGGKNDADIANLFLRSDYKQGGEYGTHSEPDWDKYVGENGYMSAFPAMDAQGKAIPGTDETPAEYRYQSTFDKKVEEGGGIPSAAPVGSLGGSRGTVEVPESAGVTDYVPQTKAVAEDPTSEAPAPGDVGAGGVVSQIKVDANSTPKQLDSNKGYLTGGRMRSYYNSRFK